MILKNMPFVFSYIPHILVVRFIELCVFLLIAFRIKVIISKSFFWALFAYFVSMLVGELFLVHHNLSWVILHTSPFLLFASLKDKEYKYYFPLMGGLIILFFIDISLALYERFFIVHLLEVDINYSEEIGIINDQLTSLVDFRAMSLFGHPLSNSNILLVASFAIYFSPVINKKLGLTFLVLAVFSILFAFASRGAAILGITLLLITLFVDIFKQNKFFIIVGFVAIGIVFYYIYLNIEEIAPRLLEKGTDDNSALYRIWTINYYFSKTFSELLKGGFENPYGENGIIMILGENGLILGGIIVITKTYLSWRVLKGMPNKQRIIVFLSYFVLANMNNNFFYVEIPSMYMLIALFISRCGLVRQYSIGMQKKNYSLRPISQPRCECKKLSPSI